jgi:hypothetical protein
MVHANAPAVLRQIERNGATEAKACAGHKRGRRILLYGHDVIERAAWPPGGRGRP